MSWPVFLGIQLLAITLIWFLPIYVAYQIGRPKHRHGFLWGLLLGWFGVIIVALLPAAKGAGSSSLPVPRQAGSLGP